MKISKTTLDVLSNFSEINDSIWIKPGNQLVAFSNGGTVLANAKIEDTFHSEFGIYDLKSFLSLVSLIQDANLDESKSEQYVTISGNGSKFKFFVAAKSIITIPPKDELELPSGDLEFTLDAPTISKVLKAAGIMMLDAVTIYSENGELYFGVSDPRQKNSDSFSVKLDGVSYDGPDLSLVIAISKLRFLPGDYKVEVSHSTGKIMIQFTRDTSNGEIPVRYWTAPESDSKVG